MTLLRKIAKPEEKLIVVLLLTAILALIVVIIIMASVPPVSRDALTHHLAVPKIWLNKGLFKELPEISFSYYPMNVDLIYLIPLSLQNDIAPKYIHFCFSLLTALLIFLYLEERLGAVYGLLGSLIFLSIPIIVKLSTTVYVDLGLIFFSTASILALFKWRDKGYQLKHLILSSLCCGLCLGTKYNGIIIFFILTCFVPITYLYQYTNKNSLKKQLKAIGVGIVFIVVSLSVCSPWLIRNIILTGNPIFPLYQNVIDSQNKDDSCSSESVSRNNLQEENLKSKGGGWRNFAVRKIVYKESLMQILLIPIRIFFEGQDDNPKHFDGVLNPFLFIIPLFLIVFHNGRCCNFESRILLLFSILYLLIAYFQVDMRIRWISPIVPSLAILSVCSLERLIQFGAKRNIKWEKIVTQAGVTILVTGFFVFNAEYIHALYKKIDPMPYLAGEIDRTTYIKRFRPEYELINWINHELPQNSKILCMFIGNRIYYFDREILINNGLFEKIINTADSSNQIASELTKAGITHLLLRYDLTENWTNHNIKKRKQILLKKFIDNKLEILMSSNGYGLFRLKPT